MYTKKITFYLLIFCCIFLFRDLHEWMHQFTNFFLMGCFPFRDFINWSVCGNNNALEVALIYLAGPIFYLFILITGLYRLITKKDFLWGFVSFVAVNPLSQLYALILKGGDVWIASKLISKDFSWIIPLFFFVFYSVLVFVFMKLLLKFYNAYFLYILLLLCPFCEYFVLNEILNPLLLNSTNVTNGFPFIFYDVLLILSILLLKKKLV